MKIESKPIAIITTIMVGIFGLYLVHLNIKIGNFNTGENNESTPNYINLEENDELTDESKVETVVENIEENIEEAVEEPIVYDNKTLNELAEQLNKSLNSTMSGKGYLIASYALEKGVDPYMATAIILQETGCKWNCSRLVNECNNVGGQVGQGCGNYSYFPSLDDGIRAFIDNLYKNYIAYGLTTPETINPKYATSQEWAAYVNRYIEEIKAQ